jgi:hypothetical protein
MVTIRCTKPLLAKLGGPTLPPGDVDPPSTTRLGDWYAAPLNVGRHRLILCTSARSLLCAAVEAKDLPQFPGRLIRAVGWLLHDLGVSDDLVARELTEMQVVRFAPTESRSVLGSMNDFRVAVDAYFRSGTRTVYLSELNRWLAHTPCGPLQYQLPEDVGPALVRSAS